MSKINDQLRQELRDIVLERLVDLTPEEQNDLYEAANIGMVRETPAFQRLCKAISLQFDEHMIWNKLKGEHRRDTTANI